MQTAVEWLDEQIQERVIAQDVVARKMIIEISIEDYMDVKRLAKEMEKKQIMDAVKYHIDLLNETEISDEEIEKESERLYPGVDRQVDRMLFINGAKWYREQLKK